MRFLIILTVLLAIYIAIFPVVDKYSKGRAETRDLRYIPQKEVLDITAAEFKNLVSDMILFDSLAFIGGREPDDNNPDDWQWLYRTVDAASYLNPHNVDPYFTAQAFLTWLGMMYDETNALLERGRKFRKNDWQIPFFIGFNHYYFLDNPNKGAEYIQLAADIPNSPRTSLIVLSSRLYAASARTEVAIAMVRNDLELARDEKLRIVYETRLESLEGRLKLEKAVEAFENKFKKKPAGIDVLVAKGFIREIPADPEGGQYLIDEQGRVSNTKAVKTNNRTIFQYNPFR